MYDSFIGIFIPAIFAHLLTDFVFQTDTSIRAKHKLPGLIVHGLIAGGLSYIFLGIIPGWQISLGIGLTHGLLDAWKLRTTKGTRLRMFVADQLGHIIILGLFSWAAVYRYGGDPGIWQRIFGWPYLLIVAVLSGSILSVYVVSFLVELYFDALGITSHPDLSAGGVDRETQGMEAGIAEGGRVIGYLERGLITLFILAGYPAGIGFLIAAKSVFRFGELTDSNRRWQAEYIIIGTLLSILLGTSFAYLTAWVVKTIIP